MSELCMWQNKLQIVLFLSCVRTRAHAAEEAGWKRNRDVEQ